MLACAETFFLADLDFFFQISETFLEVEYRLLEEMKRWKKDGEKTNFSLIFFSLTKPLVQTLEFRFCTNSREDDSLLLSHHETTPKTPLNVKASLSGLFLT